jgi:hypothetical protein
MKVNFMIIGAQKCGTTTLFKILNNHPMVVGSEPKEPKFFSQQDEKPLDFVYYHSLFKRKEGVLYFEASTTYTFYPSYSLKIWDRIYEYNPDMKFIYVIRDPVDRIISSYMHAYTRGLTNKTIEESIQQDRYMYDITRYHTQIIPYVRKFGRDNVLILDFDDLVSDLEAVTYTVSDFLGIDANLFDQKLFNEHENKSVGNKSVSLNSQTSSLRFKVIRRAAPFLWERLSKKYDRSFSEKPQLPGELIDMIYNMLELEIREMEKLMGKDLSKWIQPNPSAEPATKALK